MDTLSDELTRPIIGIENRTPQEVFDIMCHRMLALRKRVGGESAAIAAYQAKGGEAPAIHATTDTAELKPVAWRVKDYADGWIIYTDEKRARIESVVMSGALVEPLYSADALSSLVRERDEALKHAETLLATAREDFVLMKETAGTVQSLTARATAAEADAARMRDAPAGYVLAPVEPTPEMLRAGMDDLGWWVEPYEAPRESGVPIDSDMSAEDAAVINAQQIEVVASCYRAMLAAALRMEGK